MKKLIPFSAFLVLASLITASAHSNTEPIWKQNLDKEVEWTQLTSIGVLLVGTSDWGLHGFDAKSGKLLWSNEKIYNSAKSLKGPDGKKVGYQPSMLRILEDEANPKYSEYAVVKYTNNIDVKNFVVINLRNGEVLIDPASAGMPVSKMLGKETVTFNYGGSDYVPGLGGIIISANWVDMMQRGQPEFQLTKMLDLNTGKVKWENDQVASDFMPVVAADGNLIMVGSKAAAKLEAESGKILWSFQVEEKKNNFEAFDANLALTVGYFYQKRGGNGILTAIDLLSGNKKWERELSTKKAPELTATGFGVIVADEKNFNLLDAESGTTKWTASKLSGLVVDLGGNLGIAVAEKDKYLTVLNKDTGAEMWSKKIKGIQIDQITGAGIMYTDEKGEFGLVSFDGKDLWTGKDKIGGNGIVLRSRPSLGTEIFYSDGKVYQVDLISGNKKVLIDDIKFQEKEVPDGLDYTGKNFVLSSSQNMLGFDENGKVLFQHHWPSPKISLAGRIALRTMQVAAVAMASATALGAGDAYGASGFGSSAGTTVQQRQLASQSQSFQDMAGGMGDAANKRFKASKSKGDYSLILTDVNGDVGLKKIDKITGEELGSIVLKDKNPVYDFDPVNGTIFYKPSKKEVICYSL